MVEAMAKKKQTPGTRPEFELVELFHRNGYMRVPNEALRQESPRDYKKGYEIRLVARTQQELATMRRLLRQVDLRAGKPFPKHNQWVQPVYGREAMDLFKSWLEAYDSKRRAKPAAKPPASKKAAVLRAAAKPAKTSAPRAAAKPSKPTKATVARAAAKSSKPAKVSAVRAAAKSGKPAKASVARAAAKSGKPAKASAPRAAAKPARKTAR
jgi:hypothetical protein